MISIASFGRDTLLIGFRGESHDDGGMSLVEVMVALFIFALVSTGFIYTMMSVMSISRDTKVRQVATQLAAEELDVARGVENVVNLAPGTRTVALNGDTYTINRAVEWVADGEASTEFKCGASSSGFKPRYKKVNVRVTWGGMGESDKPVQADSIINPREAIVEEGKATILFTVLKSDGTGAAGVSITSTPAISISATDSQGCSAALKVTPGKYTFTLKKPNYVSEKHQTEPQQVNVNVIAGETISLPFQYDLAATYKVTQPAGTVLPDVTGVAATAVPFSLSFMSTQSPAQIPPQLPTTTAKLHPSAAGYLVVGGDPQKCAFVDPRTWPADDPAMPLPELESHGTKPGGTATVNLTLPTIEVTQVANQAIIAVSQNDSVAGTCAQELRYSFKAQSATNRTLSLPYGAWSLYRNTVDPANLIVRTVLDPRVPVAAP